MKKTSQPSKEKSSVIEIQVKDLWMSFVNSF